MERSIGQVARLAGISARTLRHYDDLGLLVPARTSANGYRWYGRAELLRLQRILLLRELRVPLDRLAEILDGETDERTALSRHREQLVAERDRLDRIIDTVDRTMADLEGPSLLSDEDFFTGLAERTSRLRQDLVGRFGDGVEAHFAAAEEVTAEWTRADHERAAERGRELLARMASARRGGVSPHDDEALDLVAEHHEAVLALWPADGAAYHALADVVLHHPEQRAVVADVDPELPQWLSTAIRAYAVTRLGHDPA